MRYIIISIALCLSVALFAQGSPDVEKVLARFTSTPSGTQYRTGPSAEWQTAHVDDPLYENYECRNNQGSAYGIAVNDSVSVTFPDSAEAVTASKYTGSADYKDTDGKWHSMPVATQVSATEVRTGVITTLPISITSGRGILKPRDWGGLGME